MKTQNLPNLTPLRGIAAILTVFFHLNLGSNRLVPIESTRLLLSMYLMVDFFFVLSGFIMMHVYGDWFAKEVQKNNYWKFLRARFARVYPLHILTLVYLVALVLFFKSKGGSFDGNPFNEYSFSWNTIASNVLLVQAMNVHHWFSWNNAAWSISTEWWMYVLFPFLVVPFYRIGHRGRWLLVAICVMGYLIIMYLLQPITHIPAPMQFIRPFLAKTINVCYEWGFLRCLFGFVLGMVTYSFYKENRFSNLARPIWFLLFVILFFLSVHFPLPNVVSVLFFPPIILGAAYGWAGLNRVLGLRIFQRLGDWSFAIYLVHQPIIYSIELLTSLGKNTTTLPELPQAQNYLINWGQAAAFLAFTILISWLVYTFYEKPMRRLINKTY